MNYNAKLLKEQLIRHEGKKNKVYLDTLGYKTVGIGHLLTGESKSLPVGHIVSEEQIQAWFDQDILFAYNKARRIVTPAVFDKMDDVRQRVMIDLAFNMGDKLEQFQNTLSFIRKQEWNAAALNLKKSLWFKQVKSRGVTITEALRTGKFEWETPAKK